MRKTVVFCISVSISIILFSCDGDYDSKENAQTESQSISEPVTFAVFGNTGYATDDGKTFEEIIQAVNEYGIDFSVDLGNRLPEGVPSSGVRPLWNIAEEYFIRFDEPVYPVAGRNDIFDHISSIEYSQRYGPSWYSFNRGRIRFIVLNTEDNAYSIGFGTKPMIGEEQLEWLWNTLRETRDNESSVLFMSCPLWEEYPALWSEQLLPVLRAGQVSLIITGFKNGLYDWGRIDGIRAVSTGCTGPASASAPGLFPHVLVITVEDDSNSFTVLSPDGSTFEGITITAEENDTYEQLTAPLVLPALKNDSSWRINETINLEFNNVFEEPITGYFDFTVYPATDWTIKPERLEFSVDPGVTNTYNLGIQGIPPEFGPIPDYHAEIKIGETRIYAADSSLKMDIPRPRTGDIVPITAQVPEMISYMFDGASLKVPVEIESTDLCGRLVIYRESESGIPVCLHLSALQDFRLGLNEFQWNGLDLSGNRVVPGILSYQMVIYNKKAPVTWVAEGPPNHNGTFSVKRTLSGLIAETHDSETLLSYSINSSMSIPKSEVIQSFSGYLDSMPLTGYAHGEYDRIYLAADAGIVCLFLARNAVMPDISFGDGGYARFTEYRGRLTGCPVFYNGSLYTGIGGGRGNDPGIIILDGRTGTETGYIDLGRFYSEYTDPPAIYVDNRGIYCAHPNDSQVLLMSHTGDVLWENGSGDTRIGELDSDGRSFTYGISTDQYGFTYVMTPGTSARCGVLGPDGRGLFRVILVQLPGIRVSSVVPMIEGEATDGLYFITRGGNMPYVFHVPYTIRAGTIVEKMNETE